MLQTFKRFLFLSPVTMLCISGCANTQKLSVGRQDISRISQQDFPSTSQTEEYKLTNSIGMQEAKLAELRIQKDDLDELEKMKKRNDEFKNIPVKRLPTLEETIATKEKELKADKDRLEAEQKKREGIFSCDSYEKTSAPCVYVKLRGKPLITLIDEAARMRRFNYTVNTDISRFYVDIFDDSDGSNAKENPLIKYKMYGYSKWDELPQKKFQSMDEFVKTLIKTIKVSYKDAEDPNLRTAASKLEVRWIGDGYLFYDRENDPENPEQVKNKNTYKQNSNSAEVEQEINPSDDVVNDTDRFNTPLCKEVEGKGPKYAERVFKNPSKFPKEEYECLSPSENDQKIRQQQHARDNETRTSAPAKDQSQPGETDDTVTFKKIFLFNLSQKEVGYYLSRLFNLPYNDYYPEFSARQLTQYIGMSDGKLLDKAPNSLDRTVNNPPDDYMSTADNSVGRLISIPQQNALIIKGDYKTLQKISQVLYSIDAEFRQVMIEAKVFEYDSSLSRRIGATLDMTKSFGGSTNGSFGLKNLAIEREFGTAVASSLPINFFNISNAEKSFALLSSLALYDRDGLVRITAEPRLVVKPGQESIIDLSTTKYVQVTVQGEGSVLSDLKLVPTGVVLVIRPTLLSDEKIQLDFILRQSEFVPSQETGVQLATNSNQVLSSLVVNDGELVTIGGIEMQKFNNSHGGYPFLKNIPLFGHLFGAKSTDFSTVRVEFMIRPTIRAIGLKKYQIHDQIVTYESEVKSAIESEHGIYINNEIQTEHSNGNGTYINQ